jgi:hypothetical protein
MYTSVSYKKEKKKCFIIMFVCLMVFNANFQQYFSFIVTVSFIGGGNPRKPLTCRKSLTNFISDKV